MSKKNYGFIMDHFKKLQFVEIRWFTPVRDYTKEKERIKECIYYREERIILLRSIFFRIFRCKKSEMVGPEGFEPSTSTMSRWRHSH